MGKSNIKANSHIILVVSLRRANWWVILNSIYNFIFMFSFILRFKLACLQLKALFLCYIFTIFLSTLFIYNITCSPPICGLLFSSGLSIPLMAVSQNTSGSTDPDSPKYQLKYSKIYINTLYTWISSHYSWIYNKYSTPGYVGFNNCTVM